LSTYLWLPPCSVIPSYVLFLHLLSRGSADVPALLTEVTQAREAAAATEATRITVVLAAETSAQDAAAARDSAALCVMDVENWATLVERVALEKESRVEEENAMALASAHEDAKGFLWKITLLEGKLAV
jgi:hypothetical protein